jgi:hypothetical protein
MTASEGALHSLPCDRCKKGACPPDRAEILPRALLLLTRDADADVRAMGVDQFVHDNPDARAALV